MSNTETKMQKTSKQTENGANASKITRTTPADSQPAENKEYRVKHDFDPSMYVTVKNGFHGTLVYKSKKTGERFIWEDFGDEQEMELSELKTARNSYKTFFINNWFLFDDPEIVDWLGMAQYYKHALNAKTFDKLFESTPKEIKNTISELSDGQKKTVAYRAKQLIADGKIDSIKVITTLEESLSVELIER